MSWPDQTRSLPFSDPCQILQRFRGLYCPDDSRCDTQNREHLIRRGFRKAALKAGSLQRQIRTLPPPATARERESSSNESPGQLGRLVYLT